MTILRTLVLFVMVTALVACSTGEKETTAAVAKTQGAEITLTDVTSIDEMMTNADDYLGKTVLVSGKVIGRCGGSSCWIALDRGPDKEGLIVQTADKSFVFSEDCDNATVTIQGMLMLKGPEGEEAHAEEEGEEPHVCPNPEYYFSPVGLRIEA
ncbi:MAG TPA: hypothetical protein ENH10_03305 [Bacteroidetes bacterium]|nr:hypothetical protein BMS3Bbin04_00599 [bacterium BMS3Bbin04]HDO65044.1 hypothetical protein [Bacteroidota bacterium]HEX04169.1 hypothetical protein [Bacteroidota bacterium]